MSTARDIRSQIRSTKNTQKITSAMELVAASKMRRAQDRMSRSEAFAKKMQQVIHHMAYCCSEYKHPFLELRPTKRVGIIVVTTDRGLCGGLNINLFKSCLQKFHVWRSADIDVEICTIGKKGSAFFARTGGNVVAHADHLGDEPTVEGLIGLVKTMLDGYTNGHLDALFIAHNEFINTMTQTPKMEQLLPIAGSKEDEAAAKQHHWDYIYEPDAKSVLDMVFNRYIESQVYQAVVENLACEQSARMIAMKNATDNAQEIIENLQLAYNKARQAAITREISEIVSGADAVSS